MRLLAITLFTGIFAAAVLSPQTLVTARDAITATFADETPTSAEDQQAYDRICPLLDVYTDMDRSGREATTRTIAEMARAQRQESDDPALRALLRVVPHALGTGSTMQTAAAHALIDRECDAHGN